MPAKPRVGRSPRASATLPGRPQRTTSARTGARPTSAHPSFAAFAHGVAKKQLDKALRHEPAVRAGQDPEAIHDFRVALRRLRSALRSFGAAFPPDVAEPAAAHFRATARALSDARDLDVFLAHLPSLARRLPAHLAARLPVLEALLRARRARAHARGVRRLRERPRLHALRRFRQAFAAARAENGAAATDARPLARAIALSLAKRARKCGKRLSATSHAGDFHRLRIALKRLRYALDAIEPLVARNLRPLLRRLTGLQDLLGAANDAAVQSEDLRRWAGAACRRDAGLLLLVTTLRDRLDARAAAARRRFLRVWSSFGGRPLVDAVLAALRTPAPARSTGRGRASS